MNVDIQKIREDFPILSRTVYGKPLAVSYTHLTLPTKLEV